MTFTTMLTTMSAGMVKTCSIFFLTLLFSLPLGFFEAFGRMSRCRPLQWVVKIYIAIRRGTPLSFSCWSGTSARFTSSAGPSRDTALLPFFWASP